MMEEETVKEEVKTDLKETTKKSKPKKQIHIFKAIFNLIFWVVFIGLAFVWIVDFMNVQEEKEPKFCIKKEVHQYEDGTVKECTGLGYKVFEYNRNSFEHGRQFGPFFIKMREK